VYLLVGQGGDIQDLRLLGGYEIRFPHRTFMSVSYTKKAVLTPRLGVQIELGGKAHAFLKKALSPQRIFVGLG